MKNAAPQVPLPARMGGAGEGEVSRSRPLNALSTGEPLSPSTRVASPAGAAPDTNLPRELIKQIAHDIGQDVIAYIEVMYPEAIKATSSTFKLSVRNHTYNEIMAAIELNDVDAIRKRLFDRQAFRKAWVAAYRKLRRKHPKHDR